MDRGQIIYYTFDGAAASGEHSNLHIDCNSQY